MQKYTDTILPFAFQSKVIELAKKIEALNPKNKENAASRSSNT
jgi:hypothetical protein